LLILTIWQIVYIFHDKRFSLDTTELKLRYPFNYCRLSLRINSTKNLN